MKCVICNTEHNGTFGSGKYCCRSCANSRIRTEDTKAKISVGVRNANESGLAHKPNRKGKKLPERTEQHKKLISENRKKYWDEKGRLTEDQKKAKIKERVYTYRARKQNAIPPDADLDLIKKIYEYAPCGYQIDHIIPLSKGGLHHQDNLQYLPASENARKCNRENYNTSLIIRWQDVLPIYKFHA